MTAASGKRRVVKFRQACDKEFRHIAQQWARASLGKSVWANAYWEQVRPRVGYNYDTYRRLGGTVSRAAKTLAPDLLLGWADYRTTGTAMMMDLAGGLTFDIRGVTGVLAILLMIIHAIWATIVLLRENEQAILTFYRFSVVVWLIWLVPYFTGFFISM